MLRSSGTNTTIGKKASQPAQTTFRLVCSGETTCAPLLAQPARRDDPAARPQAPHQPRVVKRAISKYNACGKTDRTTYKATINIAIIAPPLTADDGP